MNKNTFLILVLVPFLLTSFNYKKNIKWKLEKNKNGIKVYSYIAKGESLKQIKMNTVVTSDLTPLISVLVDVGHYTDWIYNCAESRIIKKVSKTETIYYSVSDAPWPIDNRDMVLINKIYQDEKSKVVYSTTGISSYKVSKKKNMVRIPSMHGKWKFTPLKNGNIYIEYFLKIDIGGKVPAWVTNMFIAYGPYQSMVKYKKAIQLKRHKSAHFDFIKEVK